MIGTSIQTRDLAFISRALLALEEMLPFPLRYTLCVQICESGFGVTSGDVLKLTEVTALHIWKTEQ